MYHQRPSIGNAHLLGEHSRELLVELGTDEEHIARIEERDRANREAFGGLDLTKLR